jgi:hypothetical protein
MFSGAEAEAEAEAFVGEDDLDRMGEAFRCTCLVVVPLEVCLSLHVTLRIEGASFFVRELGMTVSDQCKTIENGCGNSTMIS